MAFGDGFLNIAGGVGSLVSGFSSLFGPSRRSIAAQKDLMRYQNTLALSNRDYIYRKYDSPAAQRAAMKAAGMNPFVSASGGLQPQGVGAPDPSIPSSPEMSNAGERIGSALQQGVQSLFQMEQQAKLTDSQVQLQNAQRIKTLAETTGIENQNSLFDFVRSAAESDALSKRFRAVLDEVNARFAEARAISDLDERSARIASIWADCKNKLASAAKSDAERLTIDTMRDIQRRQGEKNIELTNAQIGETSANVRRLDSLTLTENELRDARKDVLRSEEWLNTERAVGESLSNELQDWVIPRIKDRKPNESYYQMALDIADRFLEYRRQNKSEKESPSKSIVTGIILRFILSKI